jgi:SAM-dependent methyltransferase
VTEVRSSLKVMHVQQPMEETASPTFNGSALDARLQCPRCSALLEFHAWRLLCTKCQGSWPVENGIPRFFQPDYYWGEVSADEASRFVQEAREHGWRNAVQNRFRGEPEMLISLLDWQRVSWLPLLALPLDSVALDIGSGYGAITHALAKTVGKIYSVEAVPERVEFSRIRFGQEGLGNVQLVQASAMDLPFPDESFDLIVVNGVLEWVGEWERTGNPRSIQRKFLRCIQRLLKEDGKLVIGIENRFGQGLFRGGKDHSGIAYTSLMPRWLASLYLRHNREPHHRMALNPRREYRTYTYSKRGYRKLLAESGFGASDFYWADPGYNQPYSLVPLKAAFVRRHVRRKQEGLQYRRRGWRRLAAKVIAQAAPLLAPDFLILAQKGRALGRPGNSLADVSGFLPELAGVQGAICSLYTGPFSHRSAIWVFDSRTNLPQVILKMSDGTPAGAVALATEFSNLSLVASKLANAKGATFAVPLPGRCWELDKSVLATESVANGRTLAAGFAGYPSRGLARLARKLTPCVDIASELAKLLRAESAIQQLDEDDWRVPTGLEGDGDLPGLIAAARSRRRRSPNWVQHGDYTIENILVNPSTDKFTVVDWEQMVRGVTPLYDVFSLLISTLFLAARWETGPVGEPGSMQSSFRDAFFGTGSWAEMFRSLLLAASQRLAIPRDEVWTDLLEFLVLRTNMFTRKSSEMEKAHCLFLATALRCREKFVLPSHGTLRSKVG